MFRLYRCKKKAFDSVGKEGLWICVKAVGCPPNMLYLIKQLHEQTKGAILCDAGLTRKIFFFLSNPEGYIFPS